MKGVVGRFGKSEGKYMGITRDLLLNWSALSEVEVGEILVVAVKCVEFGRTTSGEAGRRGFN